ncbi:coth protein-domain-containing protein [Scenedesmus sp. NREL 46B-D3]|nr:coth protein-domain-containing protein [Scenedesmus sp. NREL 46B-D3]
MGVKRAGRLPQGSHSRRALRNAAAACMPLLVLLLLLLQAPSMVKSQAAVVAGPIVVNEVLVSAANKTTKDTPASWSVIATTTDWFELLNTGSAAVDISGWTVSAGAADSSAAAAAAAAAAVQQQQQQEQQVLGHVIPPVPAGSNLLVARGVRVTRDGVFLYDSAGDLVASTGDRLPPTRPGVTFGLPQPPSSNTSSAALPGSTPYTYLAAATPWLPNSGPLLGAGPFIHGLRARPEGPNAPGQDVMVTARVVPNLAPVAGAALLYRVNFAPEQQLIMRAAGQPGDDAEAAYHGLGAVAALRMPQQHGQGRMSFSATVPAAQFKAGDLVRWRVQATDAAGGSSIHPNGLRPGYPQYEGTVIAVPAEATSPIPVLYWYAENPAAAVTQAGSNSTLLFNGSLYDNTHANRRGVTALGWAKPKMEFAVADDGFTIAPGVPPVGDLKLNSYYVELGEISFMKEVIAYQVLREAGVVAPLSFHTQVHLNGRFYGLFGIIEEVDTNLLEHWGLPTDGPIFKSLSGELSNLRWDLPPSEMPAYYGRPNRKLHSGDWQLLANLTRGLAGGGPGSRTSFLFDNLNIPAVVNEAAVQTLLANMDRCTKNFNVYYNADTAEWIRIPWDVEASLGQDNTLGGSPGDLWCILACEQWNSPLYCDSEHPQDISGINTPWGQGLTAVGLNPFQGSATGRRSLAQAPAAGRLRAEGNKPLAFRTSDDWSSPDRVQYGSRSHIGAPGTFNHLTDAILDVSVTRTMYLRRLRTLADKYYGQDRLRQVGGGAVGARRGPGFGRAGVRRHVARATATGSSRGSMQAAPVAVGALQMVDALYRTIQPVAALDNAVWQRGDGSRGYKQITEEFIPIRGKQLLQTYAPGGANPLLPAAQVPSSSVVIGFGPSDYSDDKRQAFVSLQLRSPSGSGDSVDVSGWKLGRQGGQSFTFPPGTVFAKDVTLHLSEAVRGFRGRSSSPKAAEAAFVLQVPSGLLPDSSAAASWSLTDDQGTAVRLE